MAGELPQALGAELQETGRRAARAQERKRTKTMTNTLTITTPSDRDVVLTREFDAPAALVFEALTKPELIKRWCGVEGWTFEVCDVDLRVGGTWRFVSRKPNGKTVGQ